MVVEIMSIGLPEKKGLYNPQNEKDACGVGFIVNYKGEKSYNIVKKGIEILKNMEHRGASGNDPNTGDGAGILTQIPHEFFKIQCLNDGINLPQEGGYAVGMMFLPKEPALRFQCEGITERVIREKGFDTLGWRFVPTDNTHIGETARGTEPVIRQIFVEDTKELGEEEFEKQLFVIRKIIENEVEKLVKRNKEYFYICSFSSKTIIYKGLLLANQIEKYFLDLIDLNYKSSISLVHQRFSTNTFPTWDLAQPFRYLAHNGEINTIKGNRNWMNAREGIITSEVFASEIKKIYPILQKGKSDSASLDNAFEFIRANGRNNPHTLMMLIPEAWENDDIMDIKKKSFYEYHASMIEPWDGPAAVLFCDGNQVGGTLDRNGLRPAKYVITKDNEVVMASEFGVLNIKPDSIIKKGRLKPGEMILIDINEKKIYFDDELKEKVCSIVNYTKIVEEKRILLNDIEEKENQNGEINFQNLKEKQIEFAYSKEDINLIIRNMAENGKEPIGSTGNDTHLAILSKEPQLVFSYFRQLFAQVTNPAVDPIREGFIMSLMNFIGSQENMLSINNIENQYMVIDTPIIDNWEIKKINGLKNHQIKSTIIPMTFKIDDGISGFERALNTLYNRAVHKIEEGYNIIILSDKKTDGYNGSIPSLLAVSYLHNKLIKEKLRSKISIIVESADARETTHFALLVAYGASAVNPYLAIESIKKLVKEKSITINEKEAVKNYIEAASKGLAKILSKMGICTVQSYHGSQMFEILGLNDNFVDDFFPGTTSNIGGVGLEDIVEDVIIKHKQAYGEEKEQKNKDLPTGGLYKYRKDGEFHLFNPKSIKSLQEAAKNNDYKAYKKYTKLIDNQDKNPTTLRSLLQFKNMKSIPLEEVEPESEIIKRFCSGAMSIGSISKETHEAIAVAMNSIGAKSNSGEGGEDKSRIKSKKSLNNKNSSIKQVASGRFGVTMEYLNSGEEIQIKISQGAKPGEGGHLPGEKVSKYIGKIRHSLPGIDLISPPPHHDIYSIEDLSQLIFDLKNANKDARISVKLVSKEGVGTVAAGVAKAHADMILISGHDGGTGASPLSSIRGAGIPWEIGLSEAHQVLLVNNLRGKVSLQVDGQLKTGRDIVVACLLGGEEFSFSTSILVTLGCVMCRECHKNKCPVGIATQDRKLREKFTGNPEHTINYLRFLAREVREYMALLGFKTINEMVGRIDKLEKKKEINQKKCKKIDFSKILYRPDLPSRVMTYKSKNQRHNLNEGLDNKLIEKSKSFFIDRKKVEGSFEIHNTDRSVGSLLSSQIIKAFPNRKTEKDTLKFKFFGTAGQSFGAFTTQGVTLILEGDANDFVAKGLSGGKIIIKKPKNTDYGKSIIAGNTILYGSTSGELYINGVVGERFAVRNSGALAVVEGIGNHGCEYMTDGIVVILGEIGKNFGAGMNGGIAVVLDTEDKIQKSNTSDLVDVENLNKIDIEKIKNIIFNHKRYTNSTVAEEILENWNEYSRYLKKVIPSEYKKALEKDEKYEDIYPY